MSSSKLTAKHNISETNNDRDLLSNLPSLLIDKILKRLPLSCVAKMSILSTKWRHNWLSLKYLVFDEAFWVKQYPNRDFDLQKFKNIIIMILFNHIGPIHLFHLYIPKLNAHKKFLNYHQWLSFLSRIGVKKIILCNRDNVDECIMHSQIFDCKELVKLCIKYYILIHPPSNFKYFAYLLRLELLCIRFTEEGIFQKLTRSCPRLNVLRLEKWEGMKNVIIEAPSLQHLTIKGSFESVSFRNVLRLSTISLDLEKVVDGDIIVAKTDYAMKNLVLSCQLQDVHFGGHMCKVLAGGYATKKRTHSFDDLHKLYLTDVDLGDSNIFSFILNLLPRCPSIKDLTIIVTPGLIPNPNTRSVVQHTFDYNENIKLEHLLTMEIRGITESNEEVKLIEYVLAIGVVLQHLWFSFDKRIKRNAEIKLLRHLLRLPRASPKAKLYYLEN